LASPLEPSVSHFVLATGQVSAATSFAGAHRLRPFAAPSSVAAHPTPAPPDHPGECSLTRTVNLIWTC